MVKRSVSSSEKRKPSLCNWLGMVHLTRRLWLQLVIPGSMCLTVKMAGWEKSSPGPPYPPYHRLLHDCSFEDGTEDALGLPSCLDSGHTDSFSFMNMLAAPTTTPIPNLKALTGLPLLGGSFLSVPWKGQKALLMSVLSSNLIRASSFQINLPPPQQYLSS